MRKVLVCGAGGFIGNHLVRRLKKEGAWVRAVDLKTPQFNAASSDLFDIADLRKQAEVSRIFDRSYDEVYQLAADMGGAGYIYRPENDAEIMYHSGIINMNVAEACHRVGVGRVFFSSSACVYPSHNQQDPNHPNCAEASCYPAAPDSDYGWEKLFSERLYLAYHRSHNLPVRIARFHNIFGVDGAWTGGREKAPAAICRKVAEAKNGEEIEIWGDGKQTRSFLYIDECLEGILRLTRSEFTGPVNVGSEELVSIAELVRLTMEISGKSLSIRYIAGPLGVPGRRSHNDLIREKLGWAPSRPLREGLQKTYRWILGQIESGQTARRRAA